MPSTKETAIEFIKSLPENLSVEKIAYKLYISEKLNKAQKQMENGNFVSHDEAKERMTKWLK
ncbi:MAG: hypothetical protein ACFFAN_19110 [Promethearchaeota archaeon]